ncbi:unnamed protein product [Malus baccata var. baccata]
MADSVSDSTKGWEGEGSHEGKGKKMKKVVVTLERYRHKCLSSFGDKSFAEAYIELIFDIGGLVVWDVDETDEKQWKYVDDLYKKQFRQWKFDVQRVAERAQVDNAIVDAPADDPEEE